MPRISEISEANGDPLLEKMFAEERDMFGDLLNPTKIAAHCPPILKALKQLYASFYESGRVPPALHCLVYARVASMNGCPFWLDINSYGAYELENGEDKVAELHRWRDSDLFSDEERVALEYAEAITETGKKVDDTLFESLKTHFDEAQIVELTLGIAMENMRSKFNPTLGIESQGFCVLPR